MEFIHTARLARDLRRRTARRDDLRRRALIGLAGAILAVVLLPARATAGTYVVHACRLPNGAAASTLGWGTRSEGAIASADGCMGGGGLSIRFLDGAQPNTRFAGSWAEWVFTAPPDTRISAYSIYRHVTVHVSPGPPGEASDYRHYVDDYRWEFNRDYCNPSVCDRRGTNPGVPRSPENLVVADPVDVGRIGFLITCWRSDAAEGCPSWWKPTFVLYAADITLSDLQPPTIIGVAGDLAGVIDGTRTVLVRGLDRGGGLFRVRLTVDGTDLQEQAYDPRSSSCVKPFLNPVPCPLSGESRVPLDTSRLTDGSHTLRATVIDAAGNEASSDSYSIVVDNAGAACAYGNTAHLRAIFRRSGKTRLRTRAGRTTAVVGRLRGPDGKPLQGALRIFAREQGRQAYRQTKLVSTEADGRFRIAIRARSSRRVRLAYCAPGGGAVRHLRLDVAASSTIIAKRRVLRNGQTMLLSGHLRGARIPRNGKLVEVQAFFRNHWRTISSVRSDPDGSWGFRYRFDGTRGRVAYRFRVFLPEEASYPYEAGKSRAIRVIVIGP